MVKGLGEGKEEGGDKRYREKGREWLECVCVPISSCIHVSISNVSFMF